jgi:hypothetical protein
LIAFVVVVGIQHGHFEKCQNVGWFPFIVKVLDAHVFHAGWALFDDMSTFVVGILTGLTFRVNVEVNIGSMVSH